MGIATALVGAILTLQSIIMLMALSSSLGAAPAGMHVQATGMLGEIGGYAILAQAVTLALGVALFLASPRLAKLVAE